MFQTTFSKDGTITNGCYDNDSVESLEMTSLKMQDSILVYCDDTNFSDTEPMIIENEDSE